MSLCTVYYYLPQLVKLMSFGFIMVDKNEYALFNQKKLWQQITSNIIN